MLKTRYPPLVWQRRSAATIFRRIRGFCTGIPDSAHDEVSDRALLPGRCALTNWSELIDETAGQVGELRGRDYHVSIYRAPRSRRMGGSTSHLVPLSLCGILFGLVQQRLAVRRDGAEDAAGLRHGPKSASDHSTPLRQTHPPRCESPDGDQEAALQCDSTIPGMSRSYSAGFPRAVQSVPRRLSPCFNTALGLTIGPV